MYEIRTHGSVRGMMLDMIIQHHPTRSTFKIKSIVRLLDPQDPHLTDYERRVTQYVNLIHSFFHGKFPKDFLTSMYFNVEIYDSSPGQSGGKGKRII